jgi:CBS domain-containing protein
MSVSTLDELFAQDVDSIGSSEPASHAKRRMDTNETRSLLVVDNERLIGILRRNTLLKVSDAELEQPVSAFMTEDVPKVSRTQSVHDAHASLGGDINIEQVPVLDENGNLVGVINRGDLVAAATPTGGSTADSGSTAARIPVEEGMTVKDSTGSKLGTLKEATFKTDGNIEFMVVEHGMIFKSHKQMPGDVVDRVEDGDLILAISSTEFGMIKDLEED